MRCAGRRRALGALASTWSVAGGRATGRKQGRALGTYLLAPDIDPIDASSHRVHFAAAADHRSRSAMIRPMRSRQREWPTTLAQTGSIALNPLDGLTTAPSRGPAPGAWPGETVRRWG